jgi:DNA polymerase-3 subunit gamma/tau
MLKLLAESEAAIRRSASPRIVVETLLLRWAMMDRAVDLAEVIAGGRPVARPAPTSAPPAPPTPPAPPAPPLTAPALTDLPAFWEAVVTAVRERSRFLGEAAAAVRPVTFEAPVLTVELEDSGGLFARPLAEQAGAIEEMASALAGAPVRLRVTSRAEAAATPSPARRMTSESIRADRLKGLRSRDPALDRAADELDLEIVE